MSETKILTFFFGGEVGLSEAKILPFFFGGEAGLYKTKTKILPFLGGAAGMKTIFRFCSKILLLEERLVCFFNTFWNHDNGDHNDNGDDDHGDHEDDDDDNAILCPVLTYNLSLNFNFFGWEKQVGMIIMIMIPMMIMIHDHIILCLVDLP